MRDDLREQLERTGEARRRAMAGSDTGSTGQHATNWRCTIHAEPVIFVKGIGIRCPEGGEACRDQWEERP